MRNDWIEVELDIIANSMRRGPFGSSLKKSIFVEKGIKVYEQQHAIKKKWNIGSYYISDEKYQELNSFKVTSGDYIISCSGTIGEIYRIPNNAPPGIINQALLKIEINNSIILYKYFEFLFNFKGFKNKILNDIRGTGIQNLSGIKDIKKVPLRVQHLTYKPLYCKGFCFFWEANFQQISNRIIKQINS